MRQPFWTICLNGRAGRTATGASRGSPGSSLRRPKTDLVFTTRTGHAIEPRSINRRFDARCAKAGVRRIRVHDTRRTCGSLLAALDVHPRVAMQILRHAQISITMEIYTEVPDKATRAALKRLSDLFSGDGKRRKRKS